MYGCSDDSSFIPFAMTTKISNVDVVFISIVLWGDSFLANSKVPSIPFTNGAPKPCINGR